MPESITCSSHFKESARFARASGSSVGRLGDMRAKTEKSQPSTYTEAPLGRPSRGWARVRTFPD